MREEVYVEIARVVAAAEESRSEQPDSGRLDVPRHVLAASVYFDALATRLAAHGFRDRTVTTGLEDEARALIRSVGGSTGGGGGGARLRMIGSRRTGLGRHLRLRGDGHRV